MKSSKYRLSMDNIVEYDDKLWFLSITNNCIFSMEKDMSQLTPEIVLPYDTKRYHNYGAEPQYSYIYIYNNKFFVLPNIARKIAVYDKQSKDVRYIDYPDSEVYYTPFFCGVTIGKMLYVIPTSYKNILKIDMEKEIADVICKSYKIYSDERGIAWASIFNNNGNILFTSLARNVVFDFDSATESLKETSVDFKGDDGFSGIVGDKNSLWLVPKRFKGVLEIDQNFHLKKYFPCEDVKIEKHIISFYKVKLINGKIYMLPRDSDNIVVFDIEKKQYEFIKPAERIRNRSALDRYMPISNIWEHCGLIYYSTSFEGNIYNVSKDSMVTLPIANDMDKVPYFGFSYEDNQFFGLRKFINSL